MPREHLLFFVKAPRPGAVKTRLARSLGPAAAATAYAAFAADALAMLRGLGLPLTVCHAPEAAPAEIAAWLGSDLACRPQAGVDLGVRMAEALGWALASGAQRAVLVGSDLPDLPTGHVRAAFAALAGHDAVLAPAGDGGYGLVGFRRGSLRAAAFAGIDWSTERVMDQSLAAMARSGLDCAVLNPWPDVDAFADLHALAARLRADPAAAPRTWDWLVGQGLV